VLQLHDESFRSIHVEMVYCEQGAETDATSAEGCHGIADGSAFIYRLDGTDHLVTARHNLTGRHWQTTEWLSENRPTNPTHLRVAFFANPPQEWALSPVEENPRAAQLQVRLELHLVRLIGEDWQPIWRQHPTLGADMDVGVVPFNAPAGVMIRNWERTGPRTAPEQAPWPSQLFPAQDVFIVGYPYNLSVGPLLPLWMRGTVASDPAFGYEAEGKSYPLFLIDARTRKGQSGAPVIRYRAPDSAVFRNDGLLARTVAPDSDFVGVYSGRTSDESDLGFVWSMDEVDEICRNGVQGTLD
jgi:hypothetical protein